MLSQFEEPLNIYFLLPKMIRSNMKKQYILFTSKSICIQELNISWEKQGQGHSPMEKITTIKKNPET